MGISMSTARLMEYYGLLGTGRNLLDFGSSNLYDASAQDISAFVRRHNLNPPEDLDAWAEKLAAGSGKDEHGNALNASFAGELFEAAGMGYTALDIAIGYKTTVVDLNTQKLPADMVGAFDSVVNCGTSEHILNQMNTFAAVHAACKPGGLIMHFVPSVGWLDHGYFCYTGRFFFDMAGFNEYEIVDMWFDGSASNENLYASARNYQSYFPALTGRLNKIGISQRETLLNSLKIPTISIALVFRKTKDASFMGTVETSTSVGEVPTEVADAYTRRR